MGIFNKVSSVLATTEPVYRFNQGMQSIGAQVRPKDTRTTEELLATIDALAKRNPAIQDFVEDLKTMNPKYLGLAADTMELASRCDMTMTNIDMNKVVPQTGKSLLQHLLSIYPKASKENPKAMEFAQEVINNTDTLTSKYFLGDCCGYFEVPQAAQHLEAVKPLIKPFAESTINGGYLGTFERQANFTNLIKALINPQTDPAKISKIKTLMNLTDNAKGTYPIGIDTLAKSNESIEKINKNIEILPQVIENADKSGKTFDLADFVTKNINLD